MAKRIPAKPARKVKAGRRTAAHKAPAARRRAAAPPRTSGAFAAQGREWQQRFDASKKRPDVYPYTISGVPIRPIYGPDDVRGMDLGERSRVARRVPVHARCPPDDVPRPDVHDAPVRRLRHGARDERALSLPARPRTDRAVDRVRQPDDHGLRQRSSQVARRGGQVRRGDRLAARHGDAARRHRPGRDLHVDDDQRAGLDPVSRSTWRTPTSRGCRSRDFAARCRTTSSRSTWRRSAGASRPNPRCASSST